MQKSNPIAAILSILFMALFGLSLGARFWANDKAADNTGPTHITASDQYVFVFAAGTLYHLSSDGELLGRRSAESLGVTDDPIDLRLTANDGLVLASQRPARLQFCETQGWACHELDFQAGHRPERQFKVMLNMGRFKLLFSDARGDNLWGRTAEGAELQRLLQDNTLAGPNDLAFDAQGHLWVADTDHRRIVELVGNVTGEWEIAREHSAINELTRGKRYYPMMMAMGADGNWWVTQAAEYSDGSADLVIYHPENGAIAQVDLPGGVFATDLTVLGDNVLITDLESYRVYRVNSATREVDVFGDSSFTDAMAQLEQQQRYYTGISGAAMVAVMGFGLLMIGAAVVATPKHKRWTPVAGRLDLSAVTGDVPQVKGVHWLKRSARLDRSLKLLPVLGATLMLVMFGGMAFAYFWVQTQTGSFPAEERAMITSKLGEIFLLICLITVVFIPLVITLLKTMKSKLGTDGKQFRIRLADGRELMIQPVDIAFTDRAILYRQHVFPLKGGNRQEIYEAGEVETWIGPLLRDAQKLTQWQGLKHQWKHQNSQLIWSLVSGLAGAILLIIYLRLVD